MRLPRLFRLRSTLSLILMGFALAILPLLIAFGVITYYSNQIAVQSEVLVRQAIKATEGGRELVNQLTAMERSVLQYMVVEDEDLLVDYRGIHDDFQTTIGTLTELSLSANLNVMLIRLNIAEFELFEEFGDPLASPGKGEKPVAWFSRARDQAQDFLQQSTDWVDEELKKLQTLSGFMIKILFWVGVALVPLLLLVTALFTVLIVRPLRSVSNAIHQLGSESFDNAVVVRGPRDVEDLGKRLNGLRLQLGEIEVQKARFLRHMSHELKTPLTGLREAAELLAEEVIGPLNADQRQVVRIMRENTFIFQELIINLVNFNQALLRDQVLNLEVVELNEVIKRVVIAQQLAWKAKRLYINQDLEPLRMTADRAKLMTVVDNLLSNAIKFSPRDDTVDVCLAATDTDPPFAQIDVRDSGPGFHPDDRAMVFDAFFQGRHVPDSHVTGSGLGLSIAREYVVAHGGMIRVFDGGTTGGHIQVTLPLGQEVV